MKRYLEEWNKETIIERLANNEEVYTDEYKKANGIAFTRRCLVELQNEILDKLGYNLNEYVIFDPCSGTGNLEKLFKNKDNVYLSSYEELDVEVCRQRGFNNVEQFDFLKDDEFPKFNGKDIRQIISGRKLMIIINPPYQRVKGIKSNLAIDFFNKCLKLNPDVVVFYFKTNSFLSSEVNHYLNSKLKIQSHIITSAQKTFGLSNWSISQVIFDKNQGKALELNKIPVERYDLDRKKDFVFQGSYCYNEEKPDLIKEVEKKIKENKTGLKLGGWCYLKDCLYIGNEERKGIKPLTTENLKYCLLSKGINFNTDAKYFESNKYVFRGTVEEINEELFNDSIMFSLFYSGNSISNKNGLTNYIMPFTHEELGCSKSDLNVLRGTNEDNLFDSQGEEVFDFREFMKQFNFSEEAKDLYNKALEIVKYYHKNYEDTDFNDSFYDVKNTIMRKDPTTFKNAKIENDTRIFRQRTTKGTVGFGRKTISSVIDDMDDLTIFYDFFDARDALARKINKQLLKSGLLLWERKNLF